METDVAIGWGILIGAGLLASLYGILQFCLWRSKTDSRIAMIEAQFKALIGSFRVKGKQNENVNVARKESPGPEKTS